jgi:hypothetical protein
MIIEKNELGTSARICRHCQNQPAEVRGMAGDQGQLFDESTDFLLNESISTEDVASSTASLSVNSLLII